MVRRLIAVFGLTRRIVQMGPVFRIGGLGLALAGALMAPGAAAQDRSPLQSPATQGQSQGQDRIKAIVVTGNERVEAETVRSYMQVSPGDRFDDERINKSLKTLFATGIFADVRMRRDGDNLVVSVAENPIINRIVFEGNKHLSDDALRAEVQLKPRVVYTRSKVQTDVQRLIQLYRRSGRFAATVDPKVIKLAQNRVDLVFEISEGAVTTIASIRFVGNTKFTDSRLQEAIATKESRWYRFLSTDDTYDPDRLTYDRELLRRFYLSHGYADFRVLSAVADLTPAKDAFYVTFTLEEGVQYKFGKIDITSAIKSVDVKTLYEQLTTQEGDTYDASKIEKSIDALTFELGRHGYAFVDIRPQVHRDRKKRLIGITYMINEGPRVYVERINVTGNVRTLDKVIRREMRLSEGDAFNTAKMRRSKERIQSLGFFNKVEVNQVQGAAADRTVVNVDVQEKSTGELSFGAGYSTTESVIGDISLRERNLLGRGQDLRASLSLSGKRQQVDLGFTEPYFLGRDIAAGFDIFRTRTDFQTQSQYDQTTTGGVLRASYPITEYLSQQLNYKLRQDKINAVPATASPFVREDIGSRVTSSVGYGLTYDRRDDKIEPTSGYVLRASQDLAGLGGNVRNLRTSGSGAYYYPLADQVTASAAAEAGYIVGLGQRVDLNSRFFLGGDNFRGFATGGIGPRDSSTRDSLGGNIYYVGTAELSFPIGLPNEFGVLGRTFTQAGTLYDIDETGANLFDSSSIRASAGVGLSWRSPFGPIRVDLALPLLKQSLDRTEAFRFSFGTRF